MMLEREFYKKFAEKILVKMVRNADVNNGLSYEADAFEDAT